MHDLRQCRGGKHHDRGQHQRENAEQPDAAADDLAGFFLVALADLPAHEDRQAHGQTGDDHRDRMHDQRAGGNGGNVCGCAELTHHQQVHRAVHGLQEQRHQHRQRKPDQGREDLALRKILCLFHKTSKQKSPRSRIYETMCKQALCQLPSGSRYSDEIVRGGGENVKGKCGFWCREMTLRYCCGGRHRRIGCLS